MLNLHCSKLRYFKIYFHLITFFFFYCHIDSESRKNEHKNLETNQISSDKDRLIAVLIEKRFKMGKCFLR